MKIDVQNSSGKIVESINLDRKIFNIEMNTSVVRQAVLSELSNLRQGTHSSKNRSAVKGGGKKPWKQKGRGVARADRERGDQAAGPGAGAVGRDARPGGRPLAQQVPLLLRHWLS